MDAPTLTETEQVEILATPTPDTIQAWRNEDAGRRMYPHNAEFESVVSDAAFGGADATAEKRQAAVKELRAMLADTGLSPAEAQQLMNRSAHVRAEGRDSEQLVKDARLALQRKYGDHADAALSDVRKLVQRDPRFAKFIERKGIGNDPETVLLLAAAARSQRAAGRLK